MGDQSHATLPRRVSEKPLQVEAVLDVLAQGPPLTWGRDQLDVGDMWNFNSLVSWALALAERQVQARQPKLV